MLKWTEIQRKPRVFTDRRTITQLDLSSRKSKNQPPIISLERKYLDLDECLLYQAYK